MEPLGGPLSTQCTPSEEYWRPPLGFFKGKSLATSSARSKAKNPRGLRPLGVLAFGLALDVTSGSPLENFVKCFYKKWPYFVLPHVMCHLSPVRN